MLRRARVRVRELIVAVERDLKEGLVSLLICNLGDFVAGVLLGYFSDVVQRAPVLLALLPGASDARGDVYSSYGSRLGTLLHLRRFRELLRYELAALFSILIVVNSWVGFLAFLFAKAIVGSTIPLSLALFVAQVSAILSALFMVPATTVLAEAVHSRGYDPDNFVAPVSTFFGDIVTIPTIVAAYFIGLSVPEPTRSAVVVLLLLSALAVLTWIARLSRRGWAGWSRAWSVLKQSIPIIMGTTFLSTLAGGILLSNFEAIVANAGLLVLLPAFLEDVGAIACRFGSRLSSMLHLGRIEASLVPADDEVLGQFIANVIHAAVIFTNLALVAYPVAVLVLHKPLPPPTRTIPAVVVAGVLASIAVSILTYYITVVAWRLRIDPDNIAAPLMTSIADVIGVLALVLVVG